MLFILVIEGLSLLIEEEKKQGKIKGIKISACLSLTHLLFVDDVILFGFGSVEEWKAFKEILDIFCEASGMSININNPVSFIMTWMRISFKIWLAFFPTELICYLKALFILVAI